MARFLDGVEIWKRKPAEGGGKIVLWFKAGEGYGTHLEDENGNFFLGHYFPVRGRTILEASQDAEADFEKRR